MAPTLKEYYAMLEKHDWYYSFSDDYDVFKRGRDQAIQLNHIALNNSEHNKLYMSFLEHKTSGIGFNTPQLPKPNRPE